MRCVLDSMYRKQNGGGQEQAKEAEMHCAMPTRMSVRGEEAELVGDHGRSGLAPEA